MDVIKNLKTLIQFFEIIKRNNIDIIITLIRLDLSPIKKLIKMKNKINKNR
tara:strand:+ start:1074 stop:1226 length:153 start_codon:yes stop_codon:yes gene_type:complete